MSEAFLRLADKVANERELQTSIRHVLSLMDTLGFTLDQAMDALKIKGNSRAIIVKIIKNSSK